MTKLRPTKEASSREPHERPEALDLAYAAFRATAPSDSEVRRAVGRIKMRLGRRQRRRVRPAPFLTAALVGVGALAYAAGALNERSVSLAPVDSAPSLRVRTPDRSGDGPKASAPQAVPRRVDATQASESPGTAVPLEEAPSQERAKKQAASESPPSAAPAAARPRRPSPRSAAPTRSASWGEVSRAMAQKDFPRAERALGALARQGDASTRVNARLGLAQLALGRGDCKRAQALAREVQASGPNASAKQHASGIIERCTRKSE